MEVSALSGMDESINSLLYNSPAIIFSLGMEPSWGITFISPNVKRILGYDPDDFVSNNQFWFSNIHPDDLEKAHSGFEDLLMIGNWAREYRFRHKDGSYRWMLDELKVVYDDAYKPKQIAGSWLDITEQVQLREIAEQKQKRARDYIDHARTMFLVLDAEGIVSDINDYAAQILGYKVHEIIGKNWFHNFLTEHNRLEREWIFRSWIINKQSEKESFNSYLLTAKGEVCIVRWKAVYVLDSQGQGFIVVVGEEMTEVILAQKKLKQSEELYRLMAHYSSDIIQKIDTNGICTFASPSAEGILGFKPEELVGAPIFDYVHPDDLNRVVQAQMQVLSGMHDNLAITSRIRKKDGAYIWMETLARIIFNDNDEPKEAITVSRDISQRKRMELELEEMGQLMMAIHERLSVMSFRIGADGNVIRSFGRGLKKLGLSENQSFESNVFETFPQLKEYLRPGTWKDYFEVETSGVYANKPWWFEHFYFKDAVRDNELIGFAFDITNLKEAQNDLVQVKEMYRLLVNSFPDVAVFMFDAELRFQFAEGQSLTKNNWKSEDIVGRTLGEIFGDELSHPLYLPYKEAFRGTSRIFEYEAQGRIFQVQVIPVTDINGQINSAISISQDITERKRVEQMILNVAFVGSDMERKELSEKLHDGLGQKIATVKLLLEQIDSSLLATNPEQLELLQTSKKDINLIMTSLRELSNLMMPNVLNDFGLAAGLEELFQSVSIKGYVKVIFEHFALQPRLLPNVEMGTYRIAMELMQYFENQSAKIELHVQLFERQGNLVLRAEQGGIVDNMYERHFENTSEFFNITSRTRALKGDIHIKQLLGNRILITVEIPLNV